MSCLSEAQTKIYKQNSCIKSRFLVTESMFDDVRYEPINFVISGKGVSKKFKLQKILKISFSSCSNVLFQLA